MVHFDVVKTFFDFLKIVSNNWYYIWSMSSRMNLLVLHTVVYECICNVSTVYTGLSTRPLSRLKFERNDMNSIYQVAKGYCFISYFTVVLITLVHMQKKVCFNSFFINIVHCYVYWTEHSKPHQEMGTHMCNKRSVFNFFTFCPSLLVLRWW